MPLDPNMPLWARILRRVVRWLVFVAVLGVFCWFGFLLSGRIFFGIAIRRLGEQTNTEIKTHSVDFRSNGSVFVEELVVNPHDNDEANRVILRAQNVHAIFDLWSLFTLKPRLKRVDVDDFVFNAQYDLGSDTWNLSSINLDLPGGSPGSLPVVTLARGRLDYTKVIDSESKVAVSIPLSAGLEYDAEIEKGYRFDFETATQAGGVGESRLTGMWRPGHLQIAGGIASSDVSEFEMEWNIGHMAAELKYDHNDLFTLDMRIFDLRSERSPELDRFVVIGPGLVEKSTPFAALRRFFDIYKPRGHADIAIEASGNLKQLGQATLKGVVNCEDVAILHGRFPYQLDNLKGNINFTRDSATINGLSANHGDVRLTLDGWTRGFGPDWKYDIRVRSDNMKLDGELYNALTPTNQKSWSLFSPSGVAAIDYRLTRSSPQDHGRHLEVDLKGVDAVYRAFPYPLDKLRGRLSFDQDDVIISNLVSEAEGRKIALDGKVSGRGTDRFGYDVLIKAENVRFDSVLYDALPDEQKGLYDQFGPSGTVAGTIRASKSELPGAASKFSAELSMTRGSLRSDRLPLPLTEITSTAVLTPDRMDIKSFSGKYGSTPVSLAGWIRPGRSDRPSRYSLALEFKNARLDEDIFRLLPPSAAKIIADFQPQGNIDLTGKVSKTDGRDSTGYDFVIGCLGNSVTLPEFSYPLKNITGELRITPQLIEFRDVNAVPGDSVWIRLSTAFIKLDGTVSLAKGAFEKALLGIKANDIFFDRRLGAAMPAGLQPLYRRLVPPAHFDLDLREVAIESGFDGKKTIDIRGRARLEKCSPRISGAWTQFDADLDLNRLTVTPLDDGERRIDIDSRARLEDFSVPISGAKAQLNADVDILGRYKTNHGFEECSLAIDGSSFEILGKTFTGLNTRIAYYPEVQGWKSDGLTADCYDGKLIGKLELKKDIDGAFGYTLQTSFQDVDLRKFLSDSKIASGQGDRAAGRMEGSLNISAKFSDNSTRLGTCKLSIIDMKVGRLSPLAKLLQVLQFTEPGKYAFEKMFLDSYIKANNLHVRKLDLSGRTSAFYGSGLVDLRTRKIDLGLIARGKRHATADPSVIGSLAEGIGSAVVQIEVIGDFYDPQVITRPLPFLKGTLQMFGVPVEPK